MTDQTIEAQARAAIGGVGRAVAFPVPLNGSPIDDAVGYVDDRQGRIDGQLEHLAEVIARLTDRLTHVMTDGQPMTYPSDTELAPKPAPSEDRRSTIAKRVHGFGLTAQRQGDTIGTRIQQLTGIIDALEV